MANMRTAISASPSVALPDCTPNLMPFHIDYNGPAAVKTFMRVERLFEKTEATEGNKKPEEESLDKKPENIPLASMSEMPISELSMTRAATESTLVNESSQASLNEAASTLTVSPQTIQTQLASPPIDDVDKRFVSTFRGRSIHGLTVDLPEGYVGVVLRTTANQEVEGEGKKSEDKTSTEHGRNEEREVGMKLREPRRRGRLTSSAAPRKGAVVTISDDDNDNAPSNKESHSFLEKTHDVDMVDSPLPIPEHDDQPIRLLLPTERFNSFTLWQADRMVDKSNDEYWRTLTEWIGLAHEVSNSPFSFTLSMKTRGHRFIERIDTQKLYRETFLANYIAIDC